MTHVKGKTLGRRSNVRGLVESESDDTLVISAANEAVKSTDDW